MVVVQMMMAGDSAVGRPKIGWYLCSYVDEEIVNKIIGGPEAKADIRQLLVTCKGRSSLTSSLNAR